MRWSILLLFIATSLTTSYAHNTPIYELVTIRSDEGGKQRIPKAEKDKKLKRIWASTWSKLKIKPALLDPKHIKAKLRRTKGGAILMAILTGPLGGHRLYLGTEPYVPIVYTLTLGGGMGLLPAIDIIVILFSKDLSTYENNPQIIMWGN